MKFVVPEWKAINPFRKQEEKEDLKPVENEYFNPDVLRELATHAVREERRAKQDYKKLIRDEKVNELINLIKSRAQEGYIVADFSVFDTHCPDCRWISDEELKKLFPSFEIVPSEDHPGTERRIYWR